MVMDAQPSPQSVGREFVRQYYTLLNKAPNFLHRFYTTQSSFIHGGFDGQNREPTLVIGQKNIHNKIQQLNFRDCHAKISQVDAQATLGSGVVVQVTGELSNDGQPMRRFTQTFVLAAQSPKNYYVHNDIFRYQDYFFEDENDVESRSENDDEQDNSESSKITETGNTTGGTPVPPNPVATTPVGISVPPNVVQNVAAAPAGIPTPQQQQMYYNMQQLQQQQTVAPQTVTPTVAAPLPQRQPQQQPIIVTPTGAPIGQFNAQVNGLGHEPDATPQQVLQQQQPPTHLQQQTPQLGPQAVVTPNVVTPVIQQAVSGLPIPQPQQQHQQTPTGIIQHQPQQIHHQQQQPSPPQSQPQQHQQQVLENDKLDSVSPVSVINSGVASAPISDSEQNEPKYASSQNQEPKTFAHLLKAGSIGVNTPSPVPHNQHQPQLMGVGSGSTPQNYPVHYNRGGDNGQQQGMPQRSNSIRNKENNKNDYLDRRSFNSYSRDRSERDENQLFIGNVPQNATDEEFRDIFSKFGNIMDLRIKKNNAGPNNNNRIGPGYGFITFDNNESVLKCLSSTPIYYQCDGYEPVEINVEKKKRNDMNPRPHMTNNGPMGDRSRQTGPRSLSNSGGNGGMMRPGNNGGGNMMRGGSRSQGFNRGGMDNRGPPPNRGNSSSGGGNNNYGRR